jgi:cytochrome P450
MNENKSGNLFFVDKLRWKSMRSIMNPTFSQMKLRSLTPLINLCVSRLMNQIEKLNEKEVTVAGYIYIFIL